MESALSVIGALTVGAISCFILKGLGWRGTPVVALCAILLSFTHTLPILSKMQALLNSFTAAGLDARYVSDGLRAVGIGYLGAISADTCNALGEGSISSAVSLVTRFELIAIAVPYLSELIATVFTFLYE